MAIGIEKMHPLEGKLDSKKVGVALGTAAHHDDLFSPFTFPHAFAVIMDRYMRTYDWTEEQFAMIPPIFYDNASHNPLAHMHKTKAPVTPEAVLESYRLFQEPSLPLKLFECSQVSDGWARILVCDDEGLKTAGHRQERGHGARRLRPGHRQPLHRLARRASCSSRSGPSGPSTRAMNMAGASSEEIALQEVHDCFSVMAPLAVEITGWAEPGKGLTYFLDGHANRDGKCPINTSGGLIAKGHPISATGVAMIGWIHQQLLGKAPAELQVKDARLGTTLNIGGPICSTVVTAQRPAA